MKTIDRFSLEIIQSSFKAISEEMFITMQKTAMSPIIYEILDMGVGISDKDGNTLSSGAGIPAFIGMLEFSIKVVSNKFKHSVKKGDIYLTNDPYNGGVTHLNDMVIIKPVFFGDRLVAWVANMAHWPDIGGMVPGGISSDATELYQEGLIIPAIKAFEDNKPIPAIMDIIKANSRMAYALEGDLYAGIASVNKGEARMVELVSKYGLEHFEAATVDLQNYGESVSRKALKSLPKGKFETEEKLDDGRLIKAKIEITEDEFIVDMRENPPQNAGPDNVSRDGVVIAAQLIFKAITSPDTDSNAGTYRPLKVLTKKGTIFDPVSPAACGIYYDTDIRANDLIWRAIFPYVKDKLTVGHFSSICGTFFGGVNPDNNKPFTIVEPQIGGWGASNEADGINALFSSFHGDTFNCPAEIAESRYGVYVHRLSLSELEGGAGEFRGGKGICLEYKMRSKSWLSVGYSRSVVKPWSFEGAQEGGLNFVKVIRTNGQTEEHYMKSGIMLDEDDIIQVNTANGGGYGDPKKRKPEKILEDLKNGYISEKEAKEIYQYS